MTESGSDRRRRATPGAAGGRPSFTASRLLIGGLATGAGLAMIGTMDIVFGEVDR